MLLTRLRGDAAAIAARALCSSSSSSSSGHRAHESWNRSCGGLWRAFASDGAGSAAESSSNDAWSWPLVPGARLQVECATSRSIDVANGPHDVIRAQVCLCVRVERGGLVVVWGGSDGAERRGAARRHQPFPSPI